VTERLLLHGGHVLSMDPTIGELDTADVLIEDGRIAAVAPAVDAKEAEVLDVAGHVVLPGFVDTHRHTWQATMRALCSDWSLMEYFRGIRQTISPRYEPEDVYAGNYVGALEALDAGVTTLLDFSHCVNTPAHADAALDGLLETGIRAVFGLGYFPAPAEPPGFADHQARIDDARRIRAERLADDRGRVQMGVALTEVGLLPFDLTRAEIESAREMDALVVAHTGCVWGSPVTGGVPELDREGLIDEHQVHVHCNALTDDELDAIARAGAKVSCSPETEIQMGMGHPIMRRAMQRGMRPSLSCDVISVNSGDMFAQMRLGLQFQRYMDNDPVNQRGEMPAQIELGVRDALEWATINGATAMGLEDVTGSLTPGKQADVIVVGGPRLNMVAPIDAAGAVVLQANASNVRHVLVGGRFAKRDGELEGIDLARVGRLACESQERVLERVAADGMALLPEPQPGFDEVLAQMALVNLGRVPAPETS
jgi:cytosine/adenosine deaminase-related metal-dependent hydrolase